MSVLATTLAQFADRLDDALEQHTAQIADARAGLRDHATQLGATNISLLAVRAEVLERINTCETRVLLAIEEVKQLLEQKGRHG